MIRTEEGLRRTREAFHKLENILATVERDKDSMHPTWYATMKDPVVEQLAELQAEIDEYLQSRAAVGVDSTPDVRVPV